MFFFRQRQKQKSVVTSSSNSGKTFIQMCILRDDIVEGNGVNDVNLRLYLFFVCRFLLPHTPLNSQLFNTTPQFFLLLKMNYSLQHTKKIVKKKKIFHTSLKAPPISLVSERARSDKKKNRINGDMEVQSVRRK